MNEWLIAVVGSVLGHLVAGLTLFSFFTKVLYPVFLKKHEDVLIDIVRIFFGEEV